MSQFPATPAVNDVFSSNGFTWKWDGVAWSSYGSLATALAPYSLEVATALEETNIVTSVATVIDSFPKTKYSTVEYTIQLKQGTNYTSSKVFLVNNGTAVSHTEYAIVSPSSPVLSTITSAIVGDNVELSVAVLTASSTNVNCKAFKVSVVT
jgi:hypothetical protein